MNADKMPLFQIGPLPPYATDLQIRERVLSLVIYSQAMWNFNLTNKKPAKDTDIIPLAIELENYIRGSKQIVEG
jgi:hypothetical protein